MTLNIDLRQVTALQEQYQQSQALPRQWGAECVALTMWIGGGDWDLGALSKCFGHLADEPKSHCRKAAGRKARLLAQLRHSTWWSKSPMCTVESPHGRCLARSVHQETDRVSASASVTRFSWPSYE